jgi:hypothetical protein
VISSGSVVPYSSKSDPDEDAQWFASNPDRFAHIRTPRKILGSNRQRAFGYVDECILEFLSLGDHKAHRRRIILWRVPSDNLYYDPDKKPIIKIPLLLFSDETVEDTDEVLLPLIHSIMVDEAKKQELI